LGLDPWEIRGGSVGVFNLQRNVIMEIRKVGVLGCGLMGSGIAQVCATAGFDVTVLEVEQKFLDKGFAGIEKSLAKFAERPVEKGGITAQQKDAIRARLQGHD
jgi:3-hydroxybutyryl-CoA dehydrogenase